MTYDFQTHLQVRNNLKEILSSTPYEELMLIPDGFNNNLYWNLAHCVATQQLLHYYLSGNTFRIDKYWVETYKKGTLPKVDVSPSEIEDLGFLLTQTSKILVKDYEAGLFSEYERYPTSFGITLGSIEEAIQFNNLHEGLHYGYALAQKRAILGETH